MARVGFFDFWRDRTLFLPLALLAPFVLFALRPASAQTAYCGSVASGTYAAGFNCVAPAATPAALSTASGTVINAPVGAGLRTLSQNADSTISVTGTQVFGNTGVLANGVFAQVNGGAGAAGILFDGTLNAVTLGTFGDDAVYIQNNTAGLSSVTVAAGTRLDLTNGGTSGIERDGIDITATGGGDGTVIHRGTGTITTANGNGVFVKTQGGGSASVELSSGVAISVGKPAAGGIYGGIHTRVADSGATSITSEAALQISGTNAYGIFTQAVDGATSITNSGAIVTDGLNGFGIRAATSGLRDIGIYNSGAITTTGQAAHGIYVTSPAGVVALNNDGAITVGSAAATVGSRAIFVNPTGDIDISGSGDILVLGNAATAGGYGIIANSTVGHIFLDYSGDVTVSGNGAGAIRLDSISGNVDVDYSGDRIETFNQNGIGIYASSRSATGTVDVDAGGTIVTHADNGGGDGSGTGAFGIEAISYGGDITISYDGPLIDVNGTGAGILAGNAYFTGTGLGMIDVESSGDIVARGNQQPGIRAYGHFPPPGRRPSPTRARSARWVLRTARESLP